MALWTLGGFATFFALAVGGMLAYAASFEIDVAFLVPFAAGNFIYIAASGLVPEVNKVHGLKISLVLFGSFIAGIALLAVLRVVVAA